MYKRFSKIKRGRFVKKKKPRTYDTFPMTRVSRGLSEFILRNGPFRFPCLNVIRRPYVQQLRITVIVLVKNMYYYKLLKIHYLNR